MLYGESDCALARLELQEASEKPRRGEAARKVIRLSDCLRVTEAGGEASSPRDTSAFLLETKERPYLLAAPAAERSDWIQAICLLAFSVSAPRGGRRGGGMAWGGSLYLQTGVIRAKVRMLGAVAWGGQAGEPQSRMQGQQAERAREGGLGWPWAGHWWRS